MSAKNRWFTENFGPYERHSHCIKKYLVRKKTKFQMAQIAETFSFGLCLILDNKMQSAELDEFIYHEALVHPPMILHPDPKKVLIIGGGEGATLREVLKYKNLKEATMVDIDGEVVNFCKKYLKNWHQGSFAHPKTRLIIEDARKFIENTNEKFDVIIIDLPDPLEGGPAYLLYTVEFYRMINQHLNNTGTLSLQSEPGSYANIYAHSVIVNTFKKVFPIVRSYQTFVPSFDTPWSFCFVSKKINPDRVTTQLINKKIAQRIKGTLKFYDGQTHQGMFNPPKNLRLLIDKQKKFITDSKPVYVPK